MTFVYMCAGVTSLSLAVSYPALAVAPHMFINAYKNALAISVAQAESVKEFLKDYPSKFVVAPVSGESGGAAAAVECDEDMGFGLLSG